MKRFFKGCLIVVAVCFLLGCGLNTFVFFVTPTLNQNKWNDLKPQNYSVTIGYGSFGGIYTHYQETVTNGVAQRRSSSFGSREPTIREPIIEELFNEIKSQTLNPLALLLYWFEYDPIYGYPARFSEVDFDLGEVTEIKDFAPE